MLVFMPLLLLSAAHPPGCCKQVPVFFRVRGHFFLCKKNFVPMFIALV